MEGKNEKKHFKTNKRLAAVVFAVVISSSCAFSEISPDFSYINYNTQQSRLVNPLYLDTSKANSQYIKVNTLKTSPEKLEFETSKSDVETDVSEADITGNEPPLSPSLSSPPPIIEPSSNLVKQDDEDKNYTPETPILNSTSEYFFAPPDTQSAVINENPPSDNELLHPYTAEIYTDEEKADVVNDIDIEGRIISSIEIQGLQLINQEEVLAKIQSKTYSAANTEILQNDLQAIYASGYFTEKMSIEPTLEEDGKVKLIFMLEENVPVKDVKILGNTVIDSVELMPCTLSLKGLPQNISNINNATDKIEELYHQKGYILAKVASVDDDRDGNLIFTVNEGIIDKIFIEGNKKTKDYVVERNIVTLPGTVYNENYLKEDLSRIYSTKIFKDVDRKITPSDTVEGEYNVTVMVTEDSPNTLNIGGGIDSGIGIFGSLGYTENNFLGNGQKLNATGMIGSGILLSDASIKNRVNYNLELSFFEPYFLNADNSLTSKLYYRDLGSYQVPLAIERRIGLNTTVNHKIKDSNFSTNFTAGFENISLSEGDYDKIHSLYAIKNINIAQRAKELTGGFFINLAPGVQYNTLDSAENPRNGIIADAKFMEALSLSDFKRNTNGRLAGSITKYLPVRNKSSFSLTARGGVKVHGDELPEVMAFRLGGPYTIRGFRMSGVGTGDSFIMGSAELATPLPFADRVKWDFFQKIRFTFFVDAGKVFDPTISSKLYDRPMSAISAGIGLKVYIPSVGPISIDYGIPITNPGDYGSKNGYFTFGSGSMNGLGW